MPLKNVYIVGASSTGKSTLVNALAEHFSADDNDPSFLTELRILLPDSAEAHHAPPQFITSCRPKIIHELARPVLPQLRITRRDLGTSSELTVKAQRAILSAQCAAERSITTVPTAAEQTPANSEGEQWFISDRSALDGLVYTEFFVSEQEASKLLASEQWLECRQRMREGLVFLRGSGGLWLVDDGVRSMPISAEDWRASDVVFGRLARQEGVEVRVISREILDLAERVGSLGRR